MQNFNSLKKGLQTTLVLGVIWGIFFITSNAYSSLHNNNTNHIPAEADLIILVDANKILKKSLEGLLTTQDTKLIELIKELREGKVKGEGRESGIALNTKTILFSFVNNSQRFYGILFNIRDQQKFRNYFIKKKHLGIATTNDVGLIITTKSPSKLTKKAESLLREKHAYIDFKNIHNPITIWTKATKKYNRLNIQVEKEHIHLSGELFNPFDTESTFKPLKQDGFHTTISTIPAWINDSIQNQIDDSIPNVSGISFNYFGTELIEDPKFILAPEGDFLIQFEKPVHLNSYIEQLHKKMLVDSVKRNKVYLGPKGYYTNQISKNLIYIGVNHYDSTQLSTKQSALRISGDITKLTQVNGNGMLKYLLGIIPLYGASKQLATKVQSFEIELIKTDQKTLRVTGDIVFKENQYAYLEAIRFFLIGQFL